MIRLFGFFALVTFACEKKEDSSGPANVEFGEAVANSEEVTLEPDSSNPNLTNASIEFPAGSLSIAAGTKIFVEEASSLKRQGVLQDVGLGGEAEVSKSGASILVVANDPGAQVISPFTITLPHDSGAALVGDSDKWIVMFKTAVGKDYTSGIIPNAALRFESGQVKFNAHGFGAYQIAKLTVLVEEAKSAPSKVKTIRNSFDENVADEDGIGEATIGLRPVTREISFRSESPEFPLDDNATDLFHINSLHASRYPFVGRCTENGSVIVVTGSVELTLTCKDYAFGQDIDLGAIADGVLEVTLSMDGESKREIAIFNLIKDVTPPTVSVSNLTPSEGLDGVIQGAGGQLIDLKLNITSNDAFRYDSEIESTNVSVYTLSAYQQRPDYLDLQFSTPKITSKEQSTLHIYVCDRSLNCSTLKFGVNITSDAEKVAPGASSLVLFNQAGSDSVSHSCNQVQESSSNASFNCLIVRQTGAPVAWRPTDGVNYTEGALVGDGVKIVGLKRVGHPTSETGLLFGQTYYYAAFIANAYAEFGPASLASVTLEPLTNSQVGAAGGYYLDVKVSGDKLYAAKDTRGLEIFDIAGGNADSPVFLGRIYLEGNATRVDVSGNFAYVVLTAGGLAIVDVSNPATPTLVKTVKPNEYGSFTGVLVSGGYAYLGSSLNFHIINVQTPANAEVAGSVSQLNANRMILDGNTLYVAGGARVQAINVTDKSAPTVSATYENNNYGFVGLVKIGSELFAGTTSHSSNDGVAKLTTSNLNAVPTFFMPADYSTGDGVDVARMDNCYDSTSTCLIYTLGTSGVYASTAVPGSFTGGDTVYDTDGIATALAVNGNYIYVADKDNGIVVLQMGSTDQAKPTLSKVDEAKTISSALDIVVSGNTTLVADSWNGLTIYNTTSKTNPSHQSRVKIAGGHCDTLAVSGTTAFVGFSDEGVRAIDFSNPAAPTTSASDPNVDDVTDVSLAGANVLVSIDNGIGGGGVKVYNSSLNELGEVNGFPATRTVYDGARYAYSINSITYEAADLRIIDLQTPSSPQVAVNFDLVDYGATAISLKNGKLFVTMSSSNYPQVHKLKIYDLANPIAPSLNSSTTMSGSATKVSVEGDFVYLARGGSGVSLIHIGDITQPFAFGTMKVAYNAKAAFVSGNHVFVADGNAGITIHDRVDQ